MHAGRTTRRAVVVAVLSIGLAAPTLASANTSSDGDRDARRGRPEIVEMGDSRLKFEINDTDHDGGVQVFIDAASWTEMSIFDPGGRRIFTSTTSGRMSEQGGTELFLESAEPPFSELPLDQLLERWPEGEYSFRGRGLAGEIYVGSADLTHDIPAGPALVAPVEGDSAQDPDATTVAWEAVPAPNGSPIIGYQVLVVQPDTGLVGLPKIVLDVMMPPDATAMIVPPGFLQPDTEYEWEVLAVESSGNQTLSSSTFTTGA